MKIFFKFLLLFFALYTTNCFAQPPNQKLRVLVLTDIENEPDDAESMVRFMVYSNMWDVEGLVATTSIHQKDKIADWRIREIVTAYGKVRNNLLLHEPGFATESYMQGIIKKSYPNYGMNAVGEGKDSEGSDWIISVVDKEDDRPVWIPVWGGANCLAQALWKVQHTRSEKELQQFVSKLRVYTISDQDDSGPWIRKTFPGLFYIVSPGFHSRNGYHYGTWTGISGDHRHYFGGADTTIVSNKWLLENVRTNHGPLGAEYPKWEFIMEGDTPSFLYLMNNGLGDAEHPDYGSWGGRYELYTPRYRKWFLTEETRPIWTNTEDEVMGSDGHFYISDKATIWRWRSAFQNDFAARMDWCVKKYNEANHPPIAKLNHPNNFSVQAGDTVRLNATGSIDPDGNELNYQWMIYNEVGTYASNRPIIIQDNTKQSAYFIAPTVSKPETIHVILSVTDNGAPALTRYQRIILTVLPK